MQVIVFPLATPKFTYCSVFGDPRGTGTHMGDDICAPMGTPVLAVNNGVVSFGTDPKGGTVALLRADSGGTFYYAHLSATAGDSGRQVEPGDVIGYVGMSGNAATTLPHLHFEMWPTGAYTSAIDPMPYIATAQRFATPPPGSLPPIGRSTWRALFVGAAIVGASVVGATLINRRPRYRSWPRFV